MPGSEAEAAEPFDACLDGQGQVAEDRARAAALASSGWATSAVNPMRPFAFNRRSFACYLRSAPGRQKDTWLSTHLTRLRQN
jgi:hypothetical protein